ncbi:thiamine phosphate synthase [Sphingomonas sp. SUN039]|uniref:thiamine phosphate synthase n=1 Tax=Sphingomonas sp. SUN039 TaxID=2937787 RepID=UPI00216416E9|nr:thiamine phosphate synthase [Sphingomonas sp. SUN039]UVO55250.1 thiamine phosphate synthase [Sphingomonas sp. SUN039]
MRSRKAPLPRLWLMTDERGGDPVVLARKLPKGAGIVFRHHATPAGERRTLFERVRRVARRRRLVVLLAGMPGQARAWGADGAHHRSALPSKGLRSVAVHNRCEMALAMRVRADLVFISPVFATRSHPGARSLGVVRFGLLIGDQRQRTIALGGMTAAKFRKLGGMGAQGWAAIDAFN